MTGMIQRCGDGVIRSVSSLMWSGLRAPGTGRWGVRILAAHRQESFGEELFADSGRHDRIIKQTET